MAESGQLTCARIEYRVTSKVLRRLMCAALHGGRMVLIKANVVIQQLTGCVMIKRGAFLITAPACFIHLTIEM
ncbi:hypothetical protein [Thiospirillum jenense]|uniref:Uncharacterized protein n=1 Tax=Thiospirillum jenense TaxID=1653858 RepID=A0A839HJD3_9GAMM|nr:hypothetical protein [Thiospirillum jenense]MBB1127086.1 hypothetical protein [Thiospirillum jenense]